MTRLHLFAEGTTELVFAREVLGPHLWSYHVYLHNPVLTAHARKKGRVHRGGGRKFRPMQNDIERRLQEDHGPDVHFTTMIDLYALHQDFPGRGEADSLRNKPYDRVASLEQSWSRKTNDSRFIPFIQMHEFEAYLYTEVAKLAEFFDHASNGIEELQTIANSVRSPELIDDGNTLRHRRESPHNSPPTNGLRRPSGRKWPCLSGSRRFGRRAPTLTPGSAAWNSLRTDSR